MRFALERVLYSFIPFTSFIHPLRNHFLRYFKSVVQIEPKFVYCKQKHNNINENTTTKTHNNNNSNNNSNNNNGKSNNKRRSTSKIFLLIQSQTWLDVFKSSCQSCLYGNLHFCSMKNTLKRMLWLQLI